MSDPNRVLGLRPGASREEITRAYRKWVRRYPPELNPQRFAEIQNAYRQLSSLQNRMIEARKSPESTLASLFPLPEIKLAPPPEPPEPIQSEDVEALLKPFRRLLLSRQLRFALGGVDEE